MKLQEFNYHLPPELIAQYPLQARTGSRLFCLNKQSGQSEHRVFNQLPDLLQKGDLLIFNNTKVIPARLYGHKPTGGKIEILVERILNNNNFLAQIRASKAPKIDSEIILKNNLKLKIINRLDDLFELKFLDPRNCLEIIDQIGHMPLPPYLNRTDEELDLNRYQTVYAQNPGAVAAPTAGLHFDENLLQKINQMGVETAFVTLHVGAGTFQPVRVEDITQHKMHKEYGIVSEQVCEKITQAKNSKKRVIAVGTTTVRLLETAAQNGLIQPWQGDTNIFIYPGYEFKIIDAMITNFHLPQSTLLMLVSAFAGQENIIKAYQAAIENKYRFFSYGDAMFIYG